MNVRLLAKNIINNYPGAVGGILFSLTSSAIIFCYSLIASLYENPPDIFLVTDSFISIFLIYEFSLMPLSIMGSIPVGILLIFIKNKGSVKNVKLFLINMILTPLSLIVVNLIISILIFFSSILITLLSFLLILIFFNGVG